MSNLASAAQSVGGALGAGYGGGVSVPTYSTPAIPSPRTSSGLGGLGAITSAIGSLGNLGFQFFQEENRHTETLRALRDQRDLGSTALAYQVGQQQGFQGGGSGLGSAVGQLFGGRGGISPSVLLVGALVLVLVVLK